MASTNKPSLLSSSKNFFATAASVAASLVLVRSVANELLPHELRDYVFSGVYALRSRFSSMLTVVVPETEGFTPNQIYSASKTYLATKLPPSTRRLSVSKQEEEKTITVAVEQGEEIIDVFEGIQYRWQLVCQQIPTVAGTNGNNHQYAAPEIRSFQLSFHYKHKDAAISSYLPYILEQAKAISDAEKMLKLYMNDGDCWSPVNLHHPATFDTLAMEPELKRAVMEDLARFVKRREHYRRIGKAWKRGYLLHGPPGTGKSSLVAAMANYLKFDIYDMELTEVSWNSSLRRLLVGMGNRSILVVEDIDCSLDLQNREGGDRGSSNGQEDQKVTLSGLLNFVDGLWSSCGEERIIVFTTNYKDRIDPALLRPGRMDMHVHMGYCTPGGFRVLASNYHAVDDHPLFGEIDELMKEVEVSPAQVAEELLKSDDADVAFGEVIKFLRGKRKEADEAVTNGEKKLDVLQDQEKDACNLETAAS